MERARLCIRRSRGGGMCNQLSVTQPRRQVSGVFGCGGWSGAFVPPGLYDNHHPSYNTQRSQHVEHPRRRLQRCRKPTSVAVSLVRRWARVGSMAALLAATMTPASRECGSTRGRTGRPARIDLGAHVAGPCGALHGCLASRHAQADRIGSYGDEAVELQCGVRQPYAHAPSARPASSS